EGGLEGVGGKLGVGGHLHLVDLYVLGEVVLHGLLIEVGLGDVVQHGLQLFAGLGVAQLLAVHGHGIGVHHGPGVLKQGVLHGPGVGLGASIQVGGSQSDLSIVAVLLAQHAGHAGLHVAHDAAQLFLAGDHAHFLAVDIGHIGLGVHAIKSHSADADAQQGDVQKGRDGVTVHTDSHAAGHNAGLLPVLLAPLGGFIPVLTGRAVGADTSHTGQVGTDHGGAGGLLLAHLGSGSGLGLASGDSRSHFSGDRGHLGLAGGT